MTATRFDGCRNKSRAVNTVRGNICHFENNCLPRDDAPHRARIQGRSSQTARTINALTGCTIAGAGLHTALPLEVVHGRHNNSLGRRRVRDGHWRKPQGVAMLRSVANRGTTGTARGLPRSDVQRCSGDAIS